jgi:hypothetical protein
MMRTFPNSDAKAAALALTTQQGPAKLYLKYDH